jgi:Protein of unknown function (DUF3592)
VVARVIRVYQAEQGAVDHQDPLVRFTTRTGQVVQFLPTKIWPPPQLPVGHAVGVLYDPANPQHARLNTWTSRWGVPIVSYLLYFGFGLFLSGAGFFVTRFWVREERRA